MTDGPGWAAPDPQQPERPPPPPRMEWGVPKPGVIPLRPLGVSEILDGAISTMRAHPRTILGVSAVVVTISQLLTVVATLPLQDDLRRAAKVNQNTPNDEALAALGATTSALGISLLITLLSRVFLSGFLTVAVGKSVLGHPVSYGEIWARVKVRLLALLGLTLIYPAVAILAGAVVVVIALAAPPLAVFIALAIIPIAIWLYILFSLATPALMLEDATVFRAFGRSRTLVRDSWWRTFGIQLLATLIAVIVAAIIVIPFTLIGGDTGTPKYLILSTIGGIIAGTITEPFAAAVIVLLYTDQRMRREGMDIELARVASQPPPP